MFIVIQKPNSNKVFLSYLILSYQGRIRGAQPARAPPKIGKNMIFVASEKKFFTVKKRDKIR